MNERNPPVSDIPAPVPSREVDRAARDRRPPPWVWDRAPWLVRRDVEIPVPADRAVTGLPRTFAFFSDLHLRRATPRIDRLLREVAAANPEAVLIGGDFAGRRRFEPERLACLAALGREFPCWAVPGNWERKTGAPPVGFRDALADLGIRLLVNESADLGGGIHVVGLDDPCRGRPDPGAATMGLPDNAFRIGLVHAPDLLESHGYPVSFDLLLCGHTHGGQILLPGIGAVAASSSAGFRYLAGVYVRPDGRRIVVTRGVGTSGVPFRFRCGPEYLMLTLTRAVGANDTDTA